MSPTFLVQVLGLCNLVAGALLMFAPAAVAPLEGLHSPAAALARHSAAVLLVAIAVGAWRLPAPATRGYLWLFGVAVKIAGAATWVSAARHTGVSQVWVGAGADVLVAAVIATGLLTTRARE